MQNMKIVLRVLFLIVMLSALTACAGQGQTAVTPSEPAAKLTPYHTATPAPTLTPTPEGLPTATPPPTPTPTPRVYKVKLNDTLIGIAKYFGVTLEELQAANPGVQPAQLAIGTELIIPAAQAVMETEVTAQPVIFKVKLGEPYCTRALTGGFHCFALVSNEDEVPFGDLTAEFTLTDPGTGEKINRQALLPMSRLAPGETLPFYIFFPPSSMTLPLVTAKLINVGDFSHEADAEVPLALDNLQTRISADGATARVSGNASLTAAEKVSRIEILAVAYDDSGRVLGLRRGAPGGGWGSGENFAFNITVFSTGGQIARVEVFGKAFE